MAPSARLCAVAGSSSRFSTAVEVSATTTTAAKTIAVPTGHGTAVEQGARHAPPNQRLLVDLPSIEEMQSFFLTFDHNVGGPHPLRSTRHISRSSSAASTTNVFRTSCITNGHITDSTSLSHKP